MNKTYNRSLDYLLLASAAFKSGEPTTAARLMEKCFNDPSFEVAAQAIEVANSTDVGIVQPIPGDEQRVVPEQHPEREVQEASTNDWPFDEEESTEEEEGIPDDPSSEEMTPIQARFRRAMANLKSVSSAKKTHSSRKLRSLQDMVRK